ncbi:hypothetical protein WJX81_007857 [Elliptochloris bilobata]|uniref:Uncharacterized protein n=1 Tax=Elliptochloris bilobata TaxID=381761 RepID=A0AAW1RBL7_9CHLO
MSAAHTSARCIHSLQSWPCQHAFATRRPPCLRWHLRQGAVLLLFELTHDYFILVQGFYTDEMSKYHYRRPVKAVEFVQMQRDDELWELLISLALGSAELTGTLPYS